MLFRLSSRPFAATVLVVSAALVLGSTPADAAPQILAEPTLQGVKKASVPLVRPDSVSASVAARATGEPVEDESQRSEALRVFALPDGTWSSEYSSSPQRMSDDKGEWHDLDPELKQTGAGWEPKYAGAQIVFSAGGDRTFATLIKDGKTTTWRWASVLPAPVIDGASATYEGVAAGGSGDLVVTATRLGFKHDVVLRERPKGAFKISIPVGVTEKAGRGKVVKSKATGRIVFQDRKGAEIASAGAPLMWDASKNEAGDIEQVPVATDVVTTGNGSDTMTLTPDAGFLADPGTKYPVTIDPSYTIFQLVDTWIQNSGFSGSQYTSSELRAGTYDSGSHIARSFLKFNTDNISGQHVLAATFRMRNWYSYSCSSAAIRVNRVTESWNSTTVSWADQPAVTTTNEVDYSPAHGYSGSCGEDYSTWDVTPIVGGWASGAYTNSGLRVRGVNESTSSLTWRKYRSGDYSSSSWATPQLIVITNNYPGTATIPTASPVASYSAPGSSSSSLYTADRTPSFTTKATDADGGTVKIKYEVHNSTTVTGTSLVAECTTGYVASGSNATCSIPSGTPLPDNDSYFTRARAYDGKDWSKNWSSFRGFKVGAGTPAVPSISCPSPYSNGSWSTTTPTSDLTCTITATGTGNNAPGYVRVATENDAETQVKITPSSDPTVAKTTVTISKAAGGHKITARAETPAGTLSATGTYAFGYGSTSLVTPAIDPVPTTTDKIALSVEGPPKGASSTPTATFKWRLAGSGQNASTGWNDLDGGAVTGGTVVAGADKTTVSPTISLAGLTRDDAAGINLNLRVPTRVELQICLTYDSGTQCTWTNDQLTALRVPHAFGNGFPTAGAGPGQVALWTGEFNTSATDVSVPGYTGDLSISRSHSTFASPDTVAAGVFGPGWSAQLDGPDAGLAGLQPIDNTHIDGSIAFLDADGSALVYVAPQGRRTGPDLEEVMYEPAGDDTATSGIEFTVAGTGTGTTVTLTEEDGTTTTFKATTAPIADHPGVFAPAAVAEPGLTGTNQFVADTSGRITQIIATSAPGVTCTSSNAATTPGCRSLEITYGTETAGTEVEGQVKSISMRLWNPDKTGGAGMDSVPVASYRYDGSGRLAKVTDPRTGLSTNYAYDAGTDRLASVESAGLAPYVMSYAGSPTKLTKVTRERPDTTTATLASYVYDVPVATTGLPELGAADVARWNQAKTPTYAAAVFETAQPANLSSITASEWKDASLQFTDAEGYTINTASYGAGGWQLDATDYDPNGNVVRELDERAIRAILDGALPPGATVDQMASRTVYNADITDGNGIVLTPAGTLVVDEYRPVRMVAEAGSVELRATHTHTDYDQGAPNGGINPGTSQPYRLATTTTVTSFDPGAAADIETMSIARTGFAKNTSGAEAADFYWNLGLSTSSTTQMGATADSAVDITTSTKYDDEGKVVATLQPKSNGTDAGTTKTSYYTADGSSPVTACQNKPEWAGLVCETGPAAAPTTGPTLPTARTTGYSALLAPVIVVETSGTTTRTTTTTYLADGRASKTWTTVAGLTGSTVVPGTETEYDPTTGLAIKVHELDGAQARTGTPQVTDYDSWGRPTTYTPVTGEATTSTYDSYGRVATVTDPKGTTTWAYGGTDAAGNDEHRGLATKITYTVPGHSDAVITGAFDVGGLMSQQNLPGGVIQRLEVDTAGEPVGLTYSGQVTTVDPETGQSSTSADSPWLGWSQDNDVLGRVSHEWTPNGSAFTDGNAGANDTGDAKGYDRAYGYDRAARLIKVDDRTAATGVDVTQTAPACQVRLYGFDKNGNRTSLTRRGPAVDGSCATTGGATTSTSYDDADRITGGYAYDTLGRATTIPAASTPNGSTAGDLAIGYHDDDAVKSLTQNGQSTTYTRDIGGRRANETTGPTGGSPTRTVVRHYSDTDDNPAWIEATTGGTTTVTRYLEALAGDLAIEINRAGDITLPIADIHGDVVANVEPPATGVATSITGWADTDEYGNPLAGATPGVGGELGYGWLGAKQRATDPAAGLILMGARLYNRTTGQFSSLDPVAGGNSTAYAYPQDPINAYDLDGKRGRWCSGGWAKVCSFARHLKDRATSAWMRQRHLFGPLYMRSGRLAIHWNNHQNRIEYDKHNKYHYNRGTEHHRVRTGVGDILKRIPGSLSRRFGGLIPYPDYLRNMDPRRRKMRDYYRNVA